MTTIINSYADLVRSIGISIPVFVMDDGCILSGNDFDFDSIEEVASMFADILLQQKEVLVFNKIILGGWSYGGVIATVLILVLFLLLLFI